MRHLHTGRKLGVDSSHRIALMRSLTLALIESDAIRTLPSRAKELRWFAERVVTLAKKGDVASRRKIVQLLGSTETFKTGENRVRMAVEKIYENLVPRFKSRPGGYTQIIRLAERRAGDNSELCIMRYLPDEEDGKKKTSSGASAKTKKKSVKPEADKQGGEKVVKAKQEKHSHEAESKSKEPQDQPTKKAASKKKEQ